MWRLTDADEELVRYLLGDLPPEQRDEVELRFLADEAFHTELLAIEQDLIDAYLSNFLSPNERAQFEQSFLNSPERVEQLDAARALLAFIDAREVPSVRDVAEDDRETAPGMLACPEIQGASPSWPKDRTLHVERCPSCQHAISRIWKEHCPPKRLVLAYVGDPESFPARNAFETHLKEHACLKCAQIVSVATEKGLPFRMRAAGTLRKISLALRDHSPSFGQREPQVFDARASLLPESSYASLRIQGRVTGISPSGTRVDLGTKHGLTLGSDVELYSSCTGESVGILVIRELEDNTALGAYVGPYTPRIGDVAVVTGSAGL